MHGWLLGQMLLIGHRMRISGASYQNRDDSREDGIDLGLGT